MANVVPQLIIALYLLFGLAMAETAKAYAKRRCAKATSPN
jgi:hypothetical protein